MEKIILLVLVTLVIHFSLKAQTQNEKKKPGPLSIEIGTGGKYLDNLFQRFFVQERTGEFILTFYANIEYQFKRKGPSKINAYLKLRENTYTRITQGSYEQFDIGLRYSYHSTRAELYYSGTIKKLLYINHKDQNVLFDVSEIGLRLKHRFLGKRAAVEARYRKIRENYVPLYDKRDTSIQRISLSFKYRLNDSFTPGVGYEYTIENALSSNFNQHHHNMSLLLESRLSDRVHFLMRYKIRNRNYDTQNFADINFGRNDDWGDILLELKFKISENFGFTVKNFHRHASSTRPDRDFGSANEFYLSLFYLFHN